MIVSWIVYTLLVSGLVAAAAAALERAVHALRLPVRFLWSAALCTALTLSVLAPARSSAVAGTPSGTAASPPMSSGTSGAALSTGSDRLEILAFIPDALDLAFAVVPQVGVRTSIAIAVGWLILSAALLAVGTATLLRYRARLLAWPVRAVEGVRVRVSPSTGPVVLGLLRPEIVIPSWLTSMPADMRRLVVLHEREHLRARDPLLIAAGSMIVVVMPWCMPLWWMLHRLRLAVEIDCDARVLGSGVTFRAYGSALIEIACRRPSLAPGVPALLRSRSSLKRRLLAMKPGFSRGSIARLAIVSPLGLAVLFVACEANPPTAAEIEAMDVAALEGRLDGVTAFTADSTRFFVDGQDATADEAHALPAEMIANIAVVRDPLSGSAAEVRITTNDGRPAGSAGGELRAVTDASAPGEAQAGISAGTPSPSVGISTPAEPLFIIDGNVSAVTAFNSLDPNAIESISVMKGSSVPSEYAGDPRADAGVIIVTTRAANR